MTLSARAFIVAVLALSAARADEEILSFKSWTVTADATFSCAGSPMLTVSGKPDVLDRREDLQSLTNGLATVLAQRCPNVRDVILRSGRTRRLVSLPRVAATPAPPPAPTTVTTTQVPAQTPTSAPSRRTASAPVSTTAVTAPASVQPTPTPEPVAAPRIVATSASIPTQVSVPLAGTWIGIYQVYPAYIQMTLTIANEPGADGTAQAELRVEGLEKKNTPHMGVTNATVRYRADVRTLDITAVPGGAYGRNNLMRLAFHAVYDADRRVFAGYRVGASSDASPYFVLTRQGSEGKLFKRIEDMPSGVSTAARTPFNIGGSAPSDDVLRTWASQIYKEYPDINPYRTEFGSLYLMARNLFRDEYFRSYFGKTYDELGGSDMGRINRRLEGMPAPRANFPEDRGNAAAHPMGRGFWLSVGTYAAPDIMLSVVAMRSIGAWMNQTLQRLPQLTPQRGVFDTLSGMEAEESAALGTFWPSERDAFVKAVDAQRARLADPVLLANVTYQVESATAFAAIPQLQQTLNILQSAQSRSTPTAARRAPAGRAVPMAAQRRSPGPSGEDIGSLSSMASDAVRQQLRTSVDARIATLVNEEAARDTSGITALPAGAAGLEAGAQWFTRMSQKYVSFQSIPSVAAMFQQFQQVRARQHTQAAPALQKTIATLGNAAQIDGVLTRYVGIASDRSAATAQPIFAAAANRRTELDRIAAENARRAAAEAAAAVERERAIAESKWRRPKPRDTDLVRIGLTDMYPKPNAKPLEQAIEAVVAVVTPTSFGTAFLITKDGLAITNNHVVTGATALRARFVNGEEFAARVWRTDPANDFALIQIDCPRDCFTSYLTMDPLPGPGTDVYAIGTPKDQELNNTVTKGIVSALRRNGGKIDIQSDAAVNKGNSGGPLLEAASGRVLGVVTTKRNEAEGIGFAGSILDALRTLGITLE